MNTEEEHPHKRKKEEANGQNLRRHSKKQKTGALYELLAEVSALRDTMKQLKTQITAKTSGNLDALKALRERLQQTEQTTNKQLQLLQLELAAIQPF
jgi:small-conductance mechanosensitive channel